MIGPVQWHSLWGEINDDIPGRQNKLFVNYMFFKQNSNEIKIQRQSVYLGLFQGNNMNTVLGPILKDSTR